MLWLPCQSYGCTNARRPDEVVCGTCHIRIENAMANEETRQALYANDGIHLLEAYLARWAAFEAAYGAN